MGCYEYKILTRTNVFVAHRCHPHSHLHAGTQTYQDHEQESSKEYMQVFQNGTGRGFCRFLWVTWESQKDSSPQQESQFVS